MEKIRYTKSNWKDGAACSDEDPELFYGRKLSREERQKIIDMCGQCTVRLFCLRYAVENEMADCYYAGYFFGSANQKASAKAEVKQLDAKRAAKVRSDAETESESA